MQRRVAYIIALGALAFVGCGVVDGFKDFVGAGNDPDPVTAPKDGGTTDEPDAGGPFCVPAEIPDPLLTPRACESGQWCRLIDPDEFSGSNRWSALSVAADDNVWVSGTRWQADPPRSNPSVSHWDGHRWADVAPLSPWGGAEIWANPNGKLWLAGEGGRLASWDGENLKEYTSPAPVSVTSIRGFSDSDVWAAGSFSGVLHWDGTQWSRLDTGTAYGIGSIWGADARHVWLGLSIFAFLWDGRSFTKHDAEDLRPLFGNLTGSSALDIWSGTDRGLGLWHWDGTQWTEERAAKSSDEDSYDALWARGQKDLWAARAGGGFLHWDRSRWSQLGCGFQPIVTRMSGAPNGDAWAISGVGPVRRIAGSDLRPQAFLPYDHFDLISGSSPSDIWVASSGYGSQAGQVASPDGWQLQQPAMLHWDGEQWSTLVFPESLALPHSLWSNGPSDAWTLISDKLWHWDGAKWSVFDVGDKVKGRYLWSLWSSGTDDVWLIADRALLHWDGTALSAVETGLGRDVGTVWGTSRDDVWAWGQTSIIHWDGTKWSDWTDATGDPLNFVVQVLSSGDGQVWVADYDQISHWDGEQWTKLPRFFYGELQIGVLSMALQGDHELWALGGNGNMANIVVRWDGSQWVEVAKGLGTGWWRALWAASPTEVWAVGDALNVYRLQR